MKIHILETGEPPVSLKNRYGGYPSMFERMLAPLSERFTFSSSAVHIDEPSPSPDNYDALLITGSPAGVYEEHDWIAGAEKSIRSTAQAQKPMVGVCFGHQLLSKSFGGRVEKSARGWGVGAHDYELNAETDWMTPRAARITCAVSHQDQVIEPPVGARVLGGSDFCPNGVLEYAQAPAISFQPHPEFSHEFAADLMRLRRERIPAGLIETGLQSLRSGSDRELIARWIATFLLQNAR